MKEKEIQSKLPKIPRVPLPAPEEVRIPTEQIDRLLLWIEKDLPIIARRLCWQVPVAVLIVILTDLDRWL